MFIFYFSSPLKNSGKGYNLIDGEYSPITAVYFKQE
jgi:hypothetical protein